MATINNIIKDSSVKPTSAVETGYQSSELRKYHDFKSTSAISAMNAARIEDKPKVIPK